MIRSCAANLGVALLLVSAGCDSGPTQRTVEGIVTYAGKPVDHGLIMFQPDAGRLASAGMQTDGRYSLLLAPGSYSVFLNAPPQLPAGFKEGDPLPPPDPNALPSKYSRKESSGLTATVEAGGDVQTVNFELQ